MPNVVESVAAAVLAEVLGGTWSLPFESDWSYADWELPLEEVADLRLDVAPSPELPVELDNQSSLSSQVGIDLVLRQRFGGQDLDQEIMGRVKRDLVSARVALLLELNAHFTKDRFEQFEAAAWVATRIKTLYVPVHLRTRHQFTGIVRLTFDAHTDL